MGGIFRVSGGEALKRFLEDKLEVAGRGGGEENGISHSSCVYTKA